MFGEAASRLAVRFRTSAWAWAISKLFQIVDPLGHRREVASRKLTP